MLTNEIRAIPPVILCTFENWQSELAMRWTFIFNISSDITIQMLAAFIKRKLS